MKITEVPNILRVGEIVYSEKEYTGKKHVLYRHPLKLNYDSNFPKKMRKKHISICYMFCKNDEIEKIGQSSGTNGIEGCMGFYVRSGQDDPGINRFAVNWIIREELEKGNKIDLYMIYMDLIEIEVPGLFRPERILTPVSAKGMEQVCLKQYKEVEGCYPEWNYQERQKELPDIIHEVYGQYKIDRKKK